MIVSLRQEDLESRSIIEAASDRHMTSNATVDMRACMRLCMHPHAYMLLTRAMFALRVYM